jgi:hypothetical protein
MATRHGDGYLHGAIRDRSQFFNPLTEQYVKRNDTTGQIMGAKDTPWKSVAQEPDGRKER